ncbi:Methenyltetrahydrofolate cyclohydrolase [Phycisphaerales bacterium]|nr:Methenyltetrahydrofolate cyclohydrolase [Phycisphaerales bacterium]
MSFATQPFAEFLAATASRTPTPGGGAVASAVGALAAALSQMVVSYSVGKKSLAAHEPALREAAKVLENARALFLRLAEEDAEAYAWVNELQRLPEGDPRRAEMPAALEAAVAAPMTVIAACADLLRHFASLAGMTNRQLRTDLAIAAVLADAAARSSWWNTAINASFLADASRRVAVLAQAEGLLAESARLREEVAHACAV